MVEFHRDETGHVAFRSDARMKCLAMWLTGDIQSSHEICLDLLADLEDIATGRKETESWEGNAWAAEIGATGVDLQNLWVEDLSAHHPLAEARRAAEQYWRLLADDPDRARAVTEWERDNGRQHPYPGL
ncbi:hypothetical protein ACFOW4_11680 [Micromonospora sp. GCM10011542]|uniref:hypothetical protein n=1 Tax=Micromonospora sp. GCM10011542 TaxID=3317337 RepID=UPI0036170D58